MVYIYIIYCGSTSHQAMLGNVSDVTNNSRPCPGAGSRGSRCRKRPDPEGMLANASATSKRDDMSTSIRVGRPSLHGSIEYKNMLYRKEQTCSPVTTVCAAHSRPIQPLGSSEGV